MITVPAYFNDSQRQATKDAGAISGLEVCQCWYQALEHMTRTARACNLAACTLISDNIAMTAQGTSCCVCNWGLFKGSPQFRSLPLSALSRKL